MSGLDEKTREIMNVGKRQSLALPIALEEGAPPVYVRASLAVLSSLIILLLVWANIAHVKEISAAPGEITPSTPIRKIAHLEGGIVDALPVKVGDVVKDGDPLVLLSHESADDGFSRTKARQADLYIRAERLSAQVDGRQPIYSKYEKEWPSLVAEHKKIYATATAQHTSEMQSLVSRVASAKAEYNSAKVSHDEAREQIELAQEQFDIQNSLIESGFTSKQALLEAKSLLSVSRSAVADAAARHERTRRELQMAELEKDRKDAEYRNIVAEERTKAIAELLELEQTLLVSRNRDQRLTIRASTSGTINMLTVTGTGDVIRPGEVIAEIVPLNAQMIAEVRLATKDIGHVSMGQKAEITLTTFDKKRYGVLTGVITHISADTHFDERTGESYYPAKIKLKATTKKETRLLEKVSPGMEVNVRIITNSRSMMTYLLKPVVRSVEGAFSER